MVIARGVRGNIRVDRRRFAITSKHQFIWIPTSAKEKFKWQGKTQSERLSNLPVNADRTRTIQRRTGATRLTESPSGNTVRRVDLATNSERAAVNP